MTDNKVSKATAEKIRKIRREKHLKQKDVADKAGLNENYYAKVERGDIKPSSEIYAKIVKALGVKSSDIFPF